MASVTSKSKPNEGKLTPPRVAESRPARRVLRIVKVVAVTLLILLLLLEAGSVAAYFLKTGDFFYIRNRNRVSTTRDQFQDGVGTASDGLTDFQLHPYFGFVQRARPEFVHLNNLGFQSPYDVPFRKTDPNQFIV